MNRFIYRRTYFRFYDYINNKNNVGNTQNITNLLLERSKLNKKELKKLGKIKLKSCARNTTITKAMIDHYCRIHNGRRWFNIKFTRSMIGLKAGTLVLTRVVSPINLSDKNFKELGKPIKGKKHMSMGQPNRPTKKVKKKKIRKK